MQDKSMYLAWPQTKLETEQRLVGQRRDPVAQEIDKLLLKAPALFFGKRWFLPRE